jgi:hypothetical protein
VAGAVEDVDSGAFQAAVVRIASLEVHGPGEDEHPPARVVVGAVTDKARLPGTVLGISVPR